MVAFVTGATGFVGAAVARALCARGDEVRVLARPTSDRRNLAGLALGVVEGDLANRDALARGLEGCDLAFHVAADYRFWARDPGEIYRANVDGTRAVLEAAVSAGVRRIVHTSTIGTVKIPENGKPADESQTWALEEIDRHNHYKRSKLQAEILALEMARAGAPIVVVNPSVPVGPGDLKPTPTGRLVLDFLNGRIPAYVDTGLNLIDVDDCALGHLAAAQCGCVGERYILGGDNLSLKEVLDLLGALTGLPSPRVRLPRGAILPIAHAMKLFADHVTRRPPLITPSEVHLARYRMWFDTTKARRELGLVTRPAREALLRAVRWYVAEGRVRPERLARLKLAEA
jgi:dihydroflavonol-4-reductase